MRLIDADKLKKCYEGHNGIDDKADYLSIRRMIDNQPTAYDVDKVVEKLEENASRYTKKYVTPYGNNGYKDTKAISIHKAIEIVKQSGVADDVCEWKEDTYGRWHTECNMLADNNPLEYTYCPYCRKKIKVVDDDKIRI